MILLKVVFFISERENIGFEHCLTQFLIVNLLMFLLMCQYAGKTFYNQINWENKV